jgi:putative oxidoreductase
MMFDRVHNSVIWDQRLLWVFPLIYLAIKGGGPVSIDALVLRHFSARAK